MILVLFSYAERRCHLLSFGTGVIMLSEYIRRVAKYLGSKLNVAVTAVYDAASYIPAV